MLVVIGVVVGLNTCCTTPSSSQTVPNEVRFGVGERVDYATQHQFISISTEQAWNIEIEYVAPEGESDWCQLSKSSGEGNANVLMTFGENKLNEERSLRLTVHFARDKQEFLFTQLSASSPLPTPGGDLSGWLELPSFEADGERYYHSIHMLPSTNRRERSFSVYYDSDNYLPIWVAYPLCKGNMYGSGHRTDAWEDNFDPNIPENKQLYMKNSYQGSYDRGHMLPSKSRVRSDDDNRQTFYPTNMTPQLSGLNQQKWAAIEKKVRLWAEGCDTLYVVTGAVLRTAGGSENINYTYCKSDSSKDVAIPNYYYKALLQYSIKDDKKIYQALALWLPHKAASGAPTQNDVKTIDQLEELTGIDFFVGLDDSVEATVEQDINMIYWPGIE